jgi:hypothetical protein
MEDEKIKYSRYCPNCGKVIFAGKDSCESCGWKPEIVSPKRDKVVRTIFSDNHKKILFSIAIIGTVIVLGAIYSLLTIKNDKKDTKSAKIELKENEEIKSSNESANMIKDQEVKVISIRNTVIKLGDKADYVYSILKPKDRVREPDVVQNPKHPFGLIVTQHFKVNSKLVDITFSLAGPGVNEGPYIVRKLFVEDMNDEKQTRKR